MPPQQVTNAYTRSGANTMFYFNQIRGRRDGFLQPVLPLLQQEQLKQRAGNRESGSIGGRCLHERLGEARRKSQRWRAEGRCPPLSLLWSLGLRVPSQLLPFLTLSS